MNGISREKLGPRRRRRPQGRFRPLLQSQNIEFAMKRLREPIEGDGRDMKAGRQLRRPLGFRRNPSLSHGAIDDVSLSPFAPWASKGSQVLAQRAWLNRRQLHSSTASSALRALVLCVEHGCPLSSGP